MAKPKCDDQLRLDGAPVWDGAAGLPENHWSRLFYEHIFLGFKESDFAELYKDGGRQPISPRLLASMVLLEYMCHAGDREAVENTVMRRDWRVALGIASDWEGFCPTVLVRFRKRLREAKREDLVFGAVLRRLRELRLLKGRHRARVDATRLVADVARLSRADMIQEALRVVVSDLWSRYPELAGSAEFEELSDAYGEERWLGGGRKSVERLSRLGVDGYRLLGLCGDRKVRGKETLARILSENFLVTSEGTVTPLEEEDLSSDRIRTPHEPDVSLGKKGDQVWLGDKAHVVETADGGSPNFVVGLVVTEAPVEDSTVFSEVLGQVKADLPETKQVLADSGYSSGANSEEAEEAGVELVSPPRGNTRPGAVPCSEFEIDLERGVARCPEGHESVYWHVGDREIQIRFGGAVCRGCRRFGECTTSARGRHLGISPHYTQLQRDRARAAEPGFREVYRSRAAVEATISELVRCCGLRRSRYRTASGRKLHAYSSAAALNVRRLLGWLAGDRSRPWEQTASSRNGQAQAA